MERPVDALLAHIPPPVQEMVCGSEFPRGDPAGMRRAAAVWQERAGRYEQLRREADVLVGGLRVVVGASTVIGSAVADAGNRFAEQLEQAASFCTEKATQLERNALNVEKVQWEIGFLLVTVLYQLLCAGGWSGIGGLMVARRARESFECLLAKLIAAAASESATVTGVRTALLATRVLGVGALQAGIDLGAQLAQGEHRASIDGASILTAAVAGTGAGVGGVVGARAAAALVSEATATGRLAVSAAAGVAGVFGAVSAAALMNREVDLSCADIIGGAVFGALAGRTGAGRAIEGDVERIAATSRTPDRATEGDVEPLAATSQTSGHAPRIDIAEQGIGTLQRLAATADREAMDLLWRLDGVQVVGPGGVQGRGGDGGSVSWPSGHSDPGSGWAPPGAAGFGGPGPAGGGGHDHVSASSGAGPLWGRAAVGGREDAGAGFASGRTGLLGAATRPVGGVETLPASATSKARSQAYLSIPRPHEGGPLENTPPPRPQIWVERQQQLGVPVRTPEFEVPARPVSDPAVPARPTLDPAVPAAPVSDPAVPARPTLDPAAPARPASDPGTPSPGETPQRIAPAVRADTEAGSSSTWPARPLAVPRHTDFVFTPETQGAPSDPTLAPPVLDPGEVRPGAIASPGRIADPTEIDQLSLQPTPSGDGQGDDAAPPVPTPHLAASDEPTSAAASDDSAAAAATESGAGPEDTRFRGRGTEDAAMRDETGERPAAPEADRLVQWWQATEAAHEAGVPTQSVNQYARMHQLDEQQVRRWLITAGVDPDGPLAAPDTPVPQPDSDLAADWLREMRRYLALTPDQMAELTGVGVGVWPALESARSHRGAGPWQAALRRAVRALLRRVPDARHLYGATMPRFGLDRGRPSGMGEFLRSLRESKGWTLEQLAAALGDRVAAVTDRETARGLRKGWDKHLVVLAFGAEPVDQCESSVGSALQQLREQLEVTPEQLAARMAVVARDIQDIEAGSAAPTLAIVELYVRALAPDGRAGPLLRQLRVERGGETRQFIVAAQVSMTRLHARERIGVLPSVEAWEAHLGALLGPPQGAAEGGVHLGTYLRHLRERADLTIEQLAERMSPTPAIIRALESGSSAVSAEIVEPYLAALAPRIPRFPEGHPIVGSYIRTLREVAEWTTPELADAAGVKKMAVDSMISGRSIGPDADVVAACFHALPHASATWSEVGETFTYIPKEAIVFPDPYATVSLHEYARYFQRINRIGKLKMDELFGMQINDYGRELARSSVRTALRVYDTLLCESGIPWNAFAVAWDYGYWMDPRGESVPRPVDYGSVNDWVWALRHFRRARQHEFSELIGRSATWVHHVETTSSKPSLTALRVLADRCAVPSSILREAIEKFSARGLGIDADREEVALFWRYIETRPGSEEERAIRNQIAQKYAWIPRFMARRRSYRALEDQDLLQRLHETVIRTIMHHVPGSPFIPHVMANCRGAMYKFILAQRFPDAPERTRELISKVELYSNKRYQETGAQPTAAEIAHALDLTSEQVDEAKYWQSVARPSSLDKPIESARSRDSNLTLADKVADKTPPPPIEDDPNLTDTIRDAVADLRDPDTVTRLVELNYLHGYTVAEAATQLKLDPAEAEHLLGQAAERLRALFSGESDRSTSIEWDDVMDLDP
ncbi:helix-turn-helix domain-containing protein [Nocardia sp. NPDC049149]|uniref:helix-turn-helix domain-containing protein n=1 Tax=Nocardia sp. NPDC049149 TaxID=3364315 RepID=UPI0037156A44